MHLRGPISKSFPSCPTMVGSNIKKGGDGRGPPKVGTKFIIFWGETNFLDFSRGNQPTLGHCGLGYEIYLGFCVGMQKIFE